MRTVTLIVGVVCLFAVLLDAFQTIILPRRASGRFRLTRIFYIATWKPWAFFARRLRDPRKRETVFSYYGPMSLILLAGRLGRRNGRGLRAGFSFSRQSFY